MMRFTQNLANNTAARPCLLECMRLLWALAAKDFNVETVNKNDIAYY
jgi:hypothetical protein